MISVDSLTADFVVVVQFELTSSSDNLLLGRRPATKNIVPIEDRPRASDVYLQLADISIVHHLGQ